MRRTLILALIALTLSAALCATGAAAVDRAVSAAEAHRRRAEAAARDGDLDAAAGHLRALEADWRRRARALELVTIHDALSDVEAAAADARLCLESGQTGEFYRASAGLAALLERVRRTEAIRWMNLF